MRPWAQLHVYCCVFIIPNTGFVLICTSELATLPSINACDFLCVRDSCNLTLLNTMEFIGVWLLWKQIQMCTVFYITFILFTH